MATQLKNTKYTFILLLFLWLSLTAGAAKAPCVCGKNLLSENTATNCEYGNEQDGELSSDSYDADAAYEQERVENAARAQQRGFFEKSWDWFTSTWLYSAFKWAGKIVVWILLICLVGAAIALGKFLFLYLLGPLFAGVIVGLLTFLALNVLEIIHVVPASWVWPGTKMMFIVSAVLWMLYSVFHIKGIWDVAQRPIKSKPWPKSEDGTPQYRIKDKNPEYKEEWFYDKNGAHQVHQVGDGDIWYDGHGNSWIRVGPGDFRPW